MSKRDFACRVRLNRASVPMVMQRPRQWIRPLGRSLGLVIAVSLLLALGASWVWIAVLDREPRYSGRSVTEWASGLNSPDPTTRSNAMAALRALGPPAVPVLVRSLRDRDSRLKGPFLEATPRLSARWRRWFYDRIKPFGPAQNRLAAVRGLALYGTNAPVEPLVHALHDPDRQVAAEAATALGAIGRPAVPPLIRASADTDDYVRSMACYALSIMHPPSAEAIPALIVRLGDARPYIRDQAIYALTLQGPTALPALRSSMGDPDPHVRSNALVTLQKIGSTLGRGARPQQPVR
jgi:HEAT repeat protein